MTKANPVISIIMPCYNAQAHLSKSISSILGQTFAGWELIAVDDGSIDGTAEWLRTQTDPRIRVCRQTNQGVSAARNAGLALASGQYVTFLDADDTWSATFLEKMYAALAANPHVVLTYCGWQNLGLSGPRGEPFIPPDYENPDKAAVLLEDCPWPIHACLTRNSAIIQAGGFNTRLTIGEDYLLWMEVSAIGPIIRVPEVLAQYHHHGGAQATHNLVLAVTDTLKAKQLFLQRHPNIVEKIGADRIESLTWGQLIQKGFVLQWQGNLEYARPILRKALLAGHGSLSVSLRMLPSLLPLCLHRALLTVKEKVFG